MQFGLFENITSIPLHYLQIRANLPTILCEGVNPSEFMRLYRRVNAMTLVDRLKYGYWHLEYVKPNMGIQTNRYRLLYDGNLFGCVLVQNREQKMDACRKLALTLMALGWQWQGVQDYPYTLPEFSHDLEGLEEYELFKPFTIKAEKVNEDEF